LKKDELREVMYFARRADIREILKTLEEYDISQVKAYNNRS